MIRNDIVSIDENIPDPIFRQILSKISILDTSFGKNVHSACIWGINEFEGLKEWILIHSGIDENRYFIHFRGKFELWFTQVSIAITFWSTFWVSFNSGPLKFRWKSIFDPLSMLLFKPYFWLTRYMRNWSQNADIENWIKKIAMKWIKRPFIKYSTPWSIKPEFWSTLLKSTLIHFYEPSIFRIGIQPLEISTES